ncbi:CBS domain-containing protein [Truepera radiovictrix]|uniref:Zinc metalloprotease n=1 Tax=Truepera radiovictrix (strain DSM 17093 / CIP 108686 / LMG 22925 / RQ-24) TaxID=649638 RepID=D7CRQ0_TRURR|nr:CBS domain-containing protein [Truepera radiovictrix]ADI13540.1 peptidase M50 [Truepera radiovictrix DSM 17093]WMT57897.1 CBS domain-containing protein [Truepera radiovictrix]
MFRNAYTLPFRLLGIPVRLDLSFLLILLLFTWMIGLQVGVFTRLFNALLGLTIDLRPLVRGGTPFLLGFLSTLGLFVGVALHELGHAVVARRFGVQVKDITLMFLGGVVQFDEMPRQRGAEALVAIAGPITSLLIAGVCWFVLQAVPTGFDATLFVLAFLTFQNVVLALFNLLPALPLDGGRVLRSLLALRLPYLQATEISAAISRIIALLLGFYGVLNLNLLLVILAFFIYTAVRGETQYAQTSELLAGLQVRDLMTREVISVEPDWPVSQLMQLMLIRKHLGYPVLEDGRLVGFVKLQHVRDLDEGTTVRDIMAREVSTIAPEASAVEAFRRISERDLGRLVVVDARGEMVGILSKTDLIRTLQVRLVGSEVRPSPSSSPGGA